MSVTWYWTSLESRQLHQVVKVMDQLISFVRKMLIMGDKDRAQFNTDGNIGREKEAVDQFDGEVVQGEAPNPSRNNQLGTKFDSSAFSDLYERSKSYLIINNINSRRVSRSWPHVVDDNQGVVETAVSATNKRSCKMTEKGKSYQLAIVGNERKKLAFKLTRKISMIKSMLYSVRNSIAVQEELNQLDDIFKLVERINDRMKAVDGRVNVDYKWFEQLYEMVFSFKHTINSWLKDAELERMVNHVLSRQGSKKGSKASSSSSSRSLKTRSNSSGRSSIKDKAIKERMRTAKLKAKHLFMEKKGPAEYEAESIRMQEQVVKAEACVKVLEDLDENSKDRWI